jgi:hypothetical protein
VKTPEKFEKDEIRKFLREKNCYFVAPGTYGFGVSGTADLIGCYQGCFFAIEVKREGKEPTPLQWQRIREVQAAGGKAFWGTSEKVIPEFEAWRRELLA